MCVFYLGLPRVLQSFFGLDEFLRRQALPRRCVVAHAAPRPKSLHLRKVGGTPPNPKKGVYLESASHIKIDVRESPPPKHVFIYFMHCMYISVYLMFRNTYEVTFRYLKLLVFGQYRFILLRWCHPRVRHRMAVWYGGFWISQLMCLPKDLIHRWHELLSCWSWRPLLVFQTFRWKMSVVWYLLLNFQNIHIFLTGSGNCLNDTYAKIGLPNHLEKPFEYAPPPLLLPRQSFEFPEDIRSFV